MSSHTVDKPLKVGKTDSYSLTVSEEWLNGETISTATITVDGAYLALGTQSIVGNIIYFYLTGVAVTSGTNIHIDYTTATRSDCDFVRVVIKDC